MEGIVLGDFHGFPIILEIRWIFSVYISLLTPYLFSYLKLFVAEFCYYPLSSCHVTSQNSAEQVASG